MPILSSASLTLSINEPNGRMQDHKILHSYPNLKPTPLLEVHGDPVNSYQYDPLKRPSPSQDLSESSVPFQDSFSLGMPFNLHKHNRN